MLLRWKNGRPSRRNLPLLKSLWMKILPWLIKLYIMYLGTFITCIIHAPIFSVQLTAVHVHLIFAHRLRDWQLSRKNYYLTRVSTIFELVWGFLVHLCDGSWPKSLGDGSWAKNVEQWPMSQFNVERNFNPASISGPRIVQLFNQNAITFATLKHSEDILVNLERISFATDLNSFSKFWAFRFWSDLGFGPTLLSSGNMAESSMTWNEKGKGGEHTCKLVAEIS